MTTDNQLLKRLRIVIKASGGQSKFAKACGVSQSLISLMLSGERDINFTIIRAVCHDLGYSPEWIITGKGEKQADGKKDSTKLVTEIQILRTEIELLHARMRSYEKQFEEIKAKLSPPKPLN
ncbi:YdaS antitoxin of YdaST toxin-antitoxin system [Mucilaginibacter gracilis]|uniref:YdaS antitoxin of YdaST toxin-antitoxin system n=1 Tax=Mucilaginibacter gracilis TaxID=423350 RepID=A0A495IVY2_9SPHI|nr:helix-turn-helix domain-containing protein [Mucilaginibacter gracilis]RKR80880.1 YdaS antitoxin of YdaST toxin-antitoxin system [Mucilaginibacter gracilis]